MVIKKSVIIYSLFSIILLASGCNKQKEPAPFFDGLYFKYYEEFFSSDTQKDTVWTREILYRFKQVDNGNYHVTQEVNTRRSKKMHEELEPVQYPKVGKDLIIDKNGVVIKGGNNFNFANGLLSYLWLPPEKRNEHTDEKGIPQEVEEKRTWEKWTVIPVRRLVTDTHYYDTGSGFLVGSENIGKKLRMILVDTNYSALKATISK
jgi:hypothetical protein